MIQTRYYFKKHRQADILTDEMPKRAYSYIRFSRDHQSQGDSLRRQIEATRVYCERNNLVLDESLNLRDLGISAFKGHNAKSGALGRFLDLCERGEIPSGSALVVENLDRLSRETPDRAVRLMLEILEYVELHLTMAKMVLKGGTGSGAEMGMKLMVAVMLSTRAHEESESKSTRLLEAFEAKRKRAAEGKAIVSKTVPWWMSFNAAGKIVTVPERAAVLRQIFKWTAAGWSSQRIARHLNAKRTPTWRPLAKEWSDSRIRDAIRYDAALGHLTPTAKTIAAGQEYRIENYYPRVIGDKLAEEARASMRENTVVGTTLVSKVGRPLNLLRGVLRHGGRWCRHQSHRNGTPGPDGVKAYHGYYDDHDPNHSGKKTWSIAASQLEPLIVHGLREITANDLLPTRRSSTPRRSVILRRKICGIEEKIGRLLDSIESGSKALAGRLKELERELLENRRELAKAEATEGTRAPDTSVLRSISPDLADPVMRARTANAIRRLVSRIDVEASIGELPLDNQTKGLLLGTLRRLNGKSASTTPDPVPDNKRRKPIAVLFTFRSGARRLVARFDKGAGKIR